MRGSNHNGMRQFNERTVLRAIRHNGAIPKADLARLTQLSTQTVSIIVNRLLEDGLLLKQARIRGKIGQPSVPLGIATLTFLYYNFHGLRVQKPWGYFKHFCGPIPVLTPLMLPIEIISHLARMMSLTIRLYANMLASDLLTMVFFSLFPLLLPACFLGLHFAVSFIQAYVFMLLAMIYLSQAVSHEH